jgi:N-acetylglucosamine-6-phosphate deacetylase
MQAIINCNAVTPEGVRDDACIVIQDGDISEVTSGATGKTDISDLIDAAGCTIFPGFVDIHIHGAVGVDVNAADAAGLLKVADFLAANGVTAWMPTLVPDSDMGYARVIREIDDLMRLQAGKPVAQAVGVHYEGVFANEKMCGALRPEYFKSGQWAVEGGRLPRLKAGVHMTTYAPEVEGGIELTKQLVNEKWIPSIGHTKADVETLEAAFAAGARHITHFFNAMSGLHHREVGVVGWGLMNADATFDIIADGAHVDPKVLEFACRSKSTDKVTLISDSVSPTGLGDGEYEIWGERVTVSGRRTQNERGSIAGSVITMLDAVRQMIALGFSKPEVAKMASLNPSKLLGLASTRGSIEAGKRADIVAIDEAGNVAFTMIGGVLRRPASS